jgi:Domain of unknown function (DUF4178)
MSLQNANCPNCGAPVLFRWQGTVQTTCRYCRSILVRGEGDLAAVGEVAELPLEGSPLQLGSEGVYKAKSFQVIGRLVYEWEGGVWNEWHLVMNDGSSGWLSDAQLEYAVSFQAQAPALLPASGQIQVGQSYNWFNLKYECTSITKAHYRGVEGELPFQYWDKSDVLFADLRTTDGRFGTIDYSEEPPLLFLGEVVEFDALKFRNLRAFEGWKQ